MENNKYLKISIKKLFIFVFTFLLIILLATITIKSLIFNNIARKIDSYITSTNYYIRYYFYQGWHSNITEIWVKDNNMILKENNELVTVIQDNKQYEIIENKLVVSENTELIHNNWLYIKNLQEALRNPKNIFKYSLHFATVNGKNCYKITDNKTILYFEKNTGLLVRVEELEGFITPSKNEIQSTISDYKFTFDTTKDEDIKIDLSNYNF